MKIAEQSIAIPMSTKIDINYKLSNKSPDVDNLFVGYICKQVNRSADWYTSFMTVSSANPTLKSRLRK